MIFKTSSRVSLLAEPPLRGRFLQPSVPANFHQARVVRRDPALSPIRRAIVLLELALLRCYNEDMSEHQAQIMCVASVRCLRSFTAVDLIYLVASASSFSVLLAVSLQTRGAQDKDHFGLLARQDLLRPRVPGWSAYLREGDGAIYGNKKQHSLA